MLEKFRANVLKGGFYLIKNERNKFDTTFRRLHVIIFKWRE